jgi:ATP-dependent Clp protease ATP-binding subunit ClpA
MHNELRFYEKDDFYDLKEHNLSIGFKIISVSKFLVDESLIKDFDSDAEIIDLSSLAHYTNIQALSERILATFPEATNFICDLKHRELFAFELRFLFEDFPLLNVQKNQIKKTNSLPTNFETKKIHKNITDLNDEEINAFFLEFKESLYGHDKFKDDLIEQIKVFRLFNKIGEQKVLSIFLLGESGVGKTEVARSIYKCMKGEKSLAKVNFGNYSNEFSLSSLIGSARGYIGSEDGEIFMRVRNTDIGIILIDEFEKSNATLFNYFLDVLESGKIVSSQSDEIDLNGFIIVFTSNISKENFQKLISPELRSRFDYKCLFTLLNYKDKMKYVEFRLDIILKKIRLELDISLEEVERISLINQIDVGKFVNMRDINKKIRKVIIIFLEEKMNTSAIETREEKKKYGARFLSLLSKEK